ncbi:MAG: hypothetical protein AAGA85_15935 [Bacteroidota bacterium]
MKRTNPEAYQKIEKADDLEQIVVDKRSRKRAGKAKQNRRNRHYNKTLLQKLKEDLEK